MNMRFARVLPVVGVGVLLWAVAIGGQTVITAPSNKYKPAQDVELGRQAATEVEKQLPLLREAEVTSLTASIGRRLVDAIPSEFRHPEFRYTFQVVNAREINAFALHIMADAGYDPLEMASMFKTIEQQGGSGGPQWLSSHPNPGDRYAYITREAALLDVEDPIRNSSAFTRAQTRLRQLPPAPTTEAATRTTAGRTSAPVPEGRLEPSRVPPPASAYTTYDWSRTAP